MTDIVERLRKYGPINGKWHDDMQEAADEIERLRAELARRAETLQAERDYVASLHEQIDAKRVEMAATNAAYKQVRKDCANLAEKVIPNLRAELDALKKQGPITHGVLDVFERVVHTDTRQGCHEHINDAINQFEIDEAAQWVVRPLYLAPQPAIPDGQVLLEQIADVFGIGVEARTPAVVLENVRNAARRSACLSMIEAHHTITVEDEDGEPMEEQLLSWGENPAQYIETYKTMLAQPTIPDGWQPIETAPTNGEAILIANGNGVWAAKYKAVYQSGYKHESPWMSLMLNKDHIPARLRHGKPTHWMPLPAAPKPGDAA